MIPYVLGCWMFGLVWVGVLSALAPTELGCLIVLGRAVYVGGVGIVLVVTAVIVGSSTSNPTFSPSRDGLWVYSLGAAIPVTILALLVVRPAVHRRLLVAVGTLPALAVVAAAPEAFRPWGAKLGGLASTAHNHHALVIAAIGVSVAAVAAAVSMPAREREASPATVS